MLMDYPMFNLCLLYLLNLILDYPLQSDFLAVQKAKSIYCLFVHSAIWGLGIALALVAMQGHMQIGVVLMLVFGHMIMDGFKSRRFYLKKDARDFKINPADKVDSLWFGIGQVFHVGQILLAYFIGLS